MDSQGILLLLWFTVLNIDSSFFLKKKDFSQNAPSKLMELFNWLNNPLVFRLTPTSPSSVNFIFSFFKKNNLTN